MRRGRSYPVVCLLVIVFTVCGGAWAQSGPTAAVPSLIRYSAAALNADGTPRTGVVGVMFSLYKEQQGGAALWTEIQNVKLDAAGNYSVLLGSEHVEGVPAELFTTNEARWLGVQVEGQAEQARVLLVSVPYALKAGDAETLGGRPLTDFVLTPAAAGGVATTGSTTTFSSAPAIGSVQTTQVNVNSTGTQNFLAKWTDNAGTLGDSAVSEVGGNIGINNASPGERLDIGGGSGSNYLRVLTGSNNPGTKAGFYAANTFGSAIWRIQGDASSGNFDLSTGPSFTPRMAIDAATGFTGFGVTSPQERVDIGGGSGSNFLRITAGANDPGTKVGFYAVNAAGSPMWRLQGDTSSGALDIGVGPTFNNRLFIDYSSGNIGIGTSAPGQKLSVAGAIESTAGGFKFPDTSTQTTAGVIGVNASAGISGAVSGGVMTLTADGNYVQRRITGTCATGTAMASVNSDGTVTCQTAGSGGGSLTPPVILSANIPGGGTDPTQDATLYSANTAVGVQNADPTTNFPPAGIIGHASNTGATGMTVGVVGRTDAPVGIGVVAYATGVGSQTDRATGLSAFATSTTGRTKALEGTVNSASGTVMSLHGPSGATLIEAGIGTLGSGSGTTVFHVDTSSASFTVPSFNINAPSGQTASIVLNGNVSINGSLSKPGGSFKIDYPLDPENKYLYHSFVESPDMMNIYNGVVTLDARGQAWIQMPDWFEALNMDFRYQLTAMGRPAPNLYIAREINGNRFKVAGGRPHGKVSWQVTGIRHDAYANAHRIPLVVDKTGAERGKLLFDPSKESQSAAAGGVGQSASSGAQR